MSYSATNYNAWDEGYQQGREDERKKILDILYKLVKSDYNTNKCKLMILDLQVFMWEGEQKEMLKEQKND